MACGDPNEARPAGYSKSGQWFAVCTVFGGDSPLVCEVTNTKTGATRRVVDAHAGTDKKPKRDEASELVAAQGIESVGPGPRPPLGGAWPHADVRFAFEAAVDAPAKPIVSFGGRVDDEEPVFPVRFDFPAFPAPARPPDGPTAEEWQREFSWLGAEIWRVQLSPSGAELAVVARLRGPHWTEVAAAKRTSVDAFVARIYNDTGMRHHERREYPRAAELFRKATTVDPKAALPAYNLACAYARLRDPRTEAALSTAIALGGPTAAARATKDADFEAVLREPWFARALRPR